MFITLSPACFPFVPLLSTISSFLNLFFKVGFPFFSFIEALFSRYESESEVAQSCPTLCDPIDCSIPGSSVHGIFQAVVLEWIAISFSSGSSQPRAQTQVSCIVDRRFTIWATKEVYIKSHQAGTHSFREQEPPVYPFAWQSNTRNSVSDAERPSFGHCNQQ